jgi:hypothetical protein
MQQFDRRRFEMLARVRDFGVTYGHLFPESSLAVQAFATVGHVVRDLDARYMTAAEASEAARAARTKGARRALQEHLQLLANTAAVLGGTDAGFTAHFEVQAGGDDQVLLTMARRSVQQAEAVSAQFVAHGMAPGFLAELTTVIDQFEAALRDRGRSRDRLRGARAGIRDALEVGLKAVAQLDVIVANHLRSNAIAREGWKRSRRISRPARRKPDVAVPATTGEPAVASPPVPDVVPTTA